jgi:cytochrome c-type biogenesis protein CcmH
MFFWIIVVIVCVLAAFALLAPLRLAGSGKNDGLAQDDEELATAREFYNQQLTELQRYMDYAKLGAEEFEAAKLELDHEFLRQSAAADRKVKRSIGMPVIVSASVLGIFAIAFLTYTSIGNPSMANSPLEERIQRGENIDIVEAIEKIELHLAEVPDDLQGWKVIAPIYMRQQAYDKAVRSFRNIVRIEGESADNLTDLAEATMLLQQGDASGEPTELLKKAVSIEPNHLRSQFYLAGEATNAGDNQTAITLWTNVLRGATGDEPWLETAQAGLKMAQDGLQSPLNDQSGPTQEDVSAALQLSQSERTEMISNMVAGLEERLFSSGGSPQEWQRLLRALLVQGEVDSAKKALAGARNDLKDDSDIMAEFEQLAAAEIEQLEKLEQ